MQQELSEANKLEQELIEASNREAGAYYAEMAGIEERANMEAEQEHYHVGDIT